MIRKDTIKPNVDIKNEIDVSNLGNEFNENCYS